MERVLYQKDYYGWLQENARLIREGNFSEIDTENLIEELESMGKSEKRELSSRLTILLLHLLKWQYQPHKNKGNSWRSTIRTQRNEIEIELSDSPSLRREVPDFVEYVYLRARKGAAEETGLALSTFPVDCPWTVAEIVDEDWLPV